MTKCEECGHKLAYHGEPGIKSCDYCGHKQVTNQAKVNKPRRVEIVPVNRKLKVTK